MSNSPIVKLNDMRDITRNPDQVSCDIWVASGLGRNWPWIKCGAVSIQNEERFCRISARLHRGITDFEHDSAFAFSIPLIGLKYGYMSDHTSTFTAWVNPQAGMEDFHVAPPGYDPEKLEGTYTCVQCEKHHPIVPEGNYMPPFDEKLFRRVRGARLDIHIGPNWQKLCPELFE